MSGMDHSELIASIYAATLSPQNAEETLDSLDAILFPPDPEASFLGQSGPASLQRFRNDPLLEQHIELARSIQERVGAANSPQARRKAILETVPNPSFLVTRKGRITDRNELARAKGGGDFTDLTECIADETALAEAHAFLRQAQSIELKAVLGYLDLSQEMQTSFLLKRVDAALLEADAEPVFVLTIVDFGFDSTSLRLFQEAYGLTQTESEIAAKLAEGARLTDIAEQRGISVDTVRSHLKAIKGKTGVADIAALVRLMCGFAAGSILPTLAVGNGRQSAYKSREVYHLKSGRRLEVIEQGARNGKPVILMGNHAYGAELPFEALQEAKRLGLRFLTPLRPGYGRTDSLPNLNPETALEQTASDLEALMGQMKIRRALIVSHAVGAAYALRFATRFPEKVSSLITIGRAPIWRDEWFDETPQRQRFAMRLARFFPRLLPVVIWTLASTLEWGFGREFIANACKDGKADSKAADNPETIDLMVQEAILSLRPGIEAYCLDCLVPVIDFTEEARQAKHKFLILHGDDDHIVPLKQSRAFAEAVPGTRLEVVKDAGQLLFYSHWPQVMDTIASEQIRIS